MKKRRGDRLLIVIHCEFSSHRGPRLHQLLRTWDRSQNAWPALCFPEMYILSGGYKEFFSSESHKRFCTQGYTPMHHPDFMDQCTEAMRLTKSMSTTKMKSLSRSGSSLSREESSPLFAGSASTSGGHSMPSSSSGHSLLSHSANASIGSSYHHDQNDYEDEDSQELHNGAPINFSAVVSGSPSHRNAASSISGTSPKLGFMPYAPGKQEAPISASAVLMCSSHTLSSHSLSNAHGNANGAMVRSSSFAAAFASSHGGRGSIGASSQDSSYSVSTMDTTTSVEDTRYCGDSDDGDFCSETDSHCSSSHSSLHNGWVSIVSPRDSPSSSFSARHAAPITTTGGSARYRARLGQQLVGGSSGSVGSSPSSFGGAHGNPHVHHPKPSSLGLPKSLQMSFSNSDPDLPAMTMMEVSTSPAPSPSNATPSLPTISAFSLSSSLSSAPPAATYGSFGNVRSGGMVPSGASATTANIPYGGNGGLARKPAPYGHSHSVPQLSVPNGLGSRSRTLGMLPSSSARAINSRSTSDLPNWSEKDEDDTLIASGPFTSRN